MNKQELLNCAADYIEENGFNTGTYFAGEVGITRKINNCPACAVGAMIACDPISKKQYEEEYAGRAVTTVADLLGMTVEETEQIYDYNDSHTKEEVVAWLRGGMPL